MSFLAVLSGVPHDGHPDGVTRLRIEDLNGRALTRQVPVPHDRDNDEASRSIGDAIKALGYHQDMNASGWVQAGLSTEHGRTYMHVVRKGAAKYADDVSPFNAGRAATTLKMPTCPDCGTTVILQEGCAGGIGRLCSDTYYRCDDCATTWDLDGEEI